jgi:hypothetical protein
MTESQRYFARDILELWESKHGTLGKELRQEFLFHPMLGAIVTYQWLLIRLAIEKSGKKKFQDILEFLEANKGLSTQDIQSRLSRTSKSKLKSDWALAA